MLNGLLAALVADSLQSLRLVLLGLVAVIGAIAGWYLMVPAASIDGDELVVRPSPIVRAVRIPIPRIVGWTYEKDRIRVALEDGSDLAIPVRLDAGGCAQLRDELPGAKARATRT